MNFQQYKNLQDGDTVVYDTDDNRELTHDVLQVGTNTTYLKSHNYGKIHHKHALTMQNDYQVV